MNAKTRFIIGILFFGSMMLLSFSGMTKFLTFEQLRAHASNLQLFVHGHHMLSVFIFFVLFIGTALFAIPAASMLTINASMLFGFVPAVIYTIIAASIGALGSFFIMRYLFAEFVQQHYAAHLHNFNAAVQRYGYRYLFLVRLIPVIPFFVVNMVASCLPISWKTFAITTIVGVIPMTIVLAYAGRQLATIHSWHDILTPRILMVFGAIIVVGIVPVLIERWRARSRSS